MAGALSMGHGSYEGQYRKLDAKILYYLVWIYPFVITTTHYPMCYANCNQITPKYLSFSEQTMFYHIISNYLSCFVWGTAIPHYPSGKLSVRCISNVIIFRKPSLGISGLPHNHFWVICDIHVIYKYIVLSLLICTFF